MSKNLIYANADEFHVKSTIVYAKAGDAAIAPIATDTGNAPEAVAVPFFLYWDPEFTKPVYNDELERLFLAGGMKIYNSKDEIFMYAAPIVFYSAIPGNEDNMAQPASVSVPNGKDGGQVFYYASFRESSSESEESGGDPIIQN